MDAKKISEGFVHRFDNNLNHLISGEDTYRVMKAYLGLLTKLDEPTEEMINSGYREYLMTHPAADIRAATQNVFKAMIAELKKGET